MEIWNVKRREPIASCVDDALLQPGFALTHVARRVAPTPVQIAFALQTEGFLKSLIARLHYDRQAVMTITRCCDQARAKA